GGGIRTHGTVARTRHFQCRTFGHSATPPTVYACCHHRPSLVNGGVKLAEGRGFEPPRDSRPYPISSRTPSTRLGPPSALDIQSLPGTPTFVLSNLGGRVQVPTRFGVPGPTSRSAAAF